MNVLLSNRAEKQLRTLPKIDQLAVAQKIRLIRDSGTAVPQEEKLSGYTNIFRVRVGNYRIVYRKTTQQLFIILIRHRKDVYRMIKEILK
ncbi:MAG: hypothetical protein ACD_48C00674G0003 [uncultured bacterium]|nr:MAG: hypothetical protein ACD_48C00674G0003 [uncultured bacterium]